MKTLGFIGSGNMALAMVKGILEGKGLPAGEIMAADLGQDARERASALGIEATTDNLAVAENCRYIVLSVKPQYYPAVIEEIAPVLKGDQVVITIAPGQSLEKLEAAFGKPVKLIRAMPNTPAMVGAGMSALCLNGLVREAEAEQALGFFRCFGRAEIIPEHLMDVVVGVSGSSPAYVCLFVEALADAAVAGGMPRAMAYTFAEQALYGSAKQLLETDIHPGAMKDMVSSPGGATIEAVAVLEEKGFRSAVFAASRAAVKKAGEM